MNIQQPGKGEGDRESGGADRDRSAAAAPITMRVISPSGDTAGDSLPDRRVLAVIDVGTNSVRLIVAEVEADGTYRVLDEERVMTRLGHGLAETGRLADETMTQSLQVIGNMKAIAEGLRVKEMRVIATSAVRDATNGRAFCRDVWRRHRVRIDVISPEEEAQLAFASAVRHFTLTGRSVAVVDIGGGSAEVVLAADGLVDRVYSLPLGAVRLTERFCRSDPLDKKHWKELKREVSRTIRESIGRPPFLPDAMVGSGGTFTSIASMIQCQREGRTRGVHGYKVSFGEIAHLVDRLRDTPLEARKHIPGLNPQRADIILAGLLVAATLGQRLGCQHVLVNERGIMDGMLLGMIADLSNRSANGRAQPKERLEWVRTFARKCRSNDRHCEHVALLAQNIFDTLPAGLRPAAAGREIATAAALLHDIGYLISHTGHHKHAYHLIKHGELPGFSGSEIELIANVARYHRRALPKEKHENFARLDKDSQELARRLAGILRVADGLDRTHMQTVQAVRCDASDHDVVLHIAAETNPQVEIWDAQRKAVLFERAFGRKLTIAWEKPGRGRARARKPKPAQDALRMEG